LLGHRAPKCLSLTPKNQVRLLRLSPFFFPLSLSISLYFPPPLLFISPPHSLSLLTSPPSERIRVRPGQLLWFEAYPPLKLRRVRGALPSLYLKGKSLFLQCPTCLLLSVEGTTPSIPLTSLMFSPSKAWRRKMVLKSNI